MTSDAVLDKIVVRPRLTAGSPTRAAPMNLDPAIDSRKDAKNTKKTES
jgi:hypothetical protein